MSESTKHPYHQLGIRLKTIRERMRESLAEVCGAIEVDVDMLEQIESGRLKPSEDILTLLINYFSIKEEEASKLWQMAGYVAASPEVKIPANLEVQDKPYVMIMPMDARVVYTDLVHVMVNNYGVVMNFMQGSGNNNSQPLAVARVGMSHEHAQSVLKVLQDTLQQHAEQGDSKTTKDDTKS
jgi:transcriptional regulator with XRE-family HTH domain